MIREIKRNGFYIEKKAITWFKNAGKLKHNSRNVVRGYVKRAKRFETDESFDNSLTAQLSILNQGLLYKLISNHENIFTEENIGAFGFSTIDGFGYNNLDAKGMSMIAFTNPFFPAELVNLFSKLKEEHGNPNSRDFRKIMNWTVKQIYPRQFGSRNDADFLNIVRFRKKPKEDRLIRNEFSKIQIGEYPGVDLKMTFMKYLWAPRSSQLTMKRLIAPEVKNPRRVFRQLVDYLYDNKFFIVAMATHSMLAHRLDVLQDTIYGVDIDDSEKLRMVFDIINSHHSKHMYKNSSMEFASLAYTLHYTGRNRVLRQISKYLKTEEGRVMMKKLILNQLSINSSSIEETREAVNRMLREKTTNPRGIDGLIEIAKLL